LQVEHQALLAAVHDGEQGAAAFAHGTDVAVVVALWGLDLDHFGAEVGQQGRGERAGQHAREVHDAYTLQRAGG
jgi:hypothetical protein